MSRVIVIANFKGGTAKTTTAVNLSAGLAFIKGYRVLLVDFDPQGNASMALGVDIEALKYSIKDLITGHMTDFSYLLWDKGSQLQILPANPNLIDIEPELLGSVDGRLRLKARLAPIVDQYDYVIIDTPPTRGIFFKVRLSRVVKCWYRSTWGFSAYRESGNSWRRSKKLKLTSTMISQSWGFS